MEPQSKPWNWREILTRLSPLVVAGPVLIIIFIHLFAPERKVFPDLGWVLILTGYAFLAITTTQNYLSGLKSTLSTVAELGILGTGLALVSPSDLLSYYFLYGFVISLILNVMDIAMNRSNQRAKTGTQK